MWSIPEVRKSGRTSLSDHTIRNRLNVLGITPFVIKNRGVSHVRYFYADRDFEQAITNWKPRTSRRSKPDEKSAASQLLLEPAVEKKMPLALTIRSIAEQLHASLSEVCAAVAYLALPTVLLKGGTSGKQLVQHYPSKYLKSIEMQIAVMREGKKEPTFIRRNPVQED